VRRVGEQGREAPRALGEGRIRRVGGSDAGEQQH
jgi:hypothetical protein